MNVETPCGTRGSQLLRGLKVISLSSGIAGEAAAMLLGDHGAQVLEIDTATRHEPVNLSASRKVWRRSREVNSVPASEAEKLLAERIGDVDAVITDLPLSVLESLRLEPRATVARHPRLVYALITPFGLDDPRSQQPAADSQVAAALGLPWRQQSHRDGPAMPGFPAGSYAAALLSLIGMFAALLRRARTNSGQLVETSIYDGYLSQLATGWAWGEHLPPADPVAEGRRLILGAYRCADGNYVYIHSGAKGAFSRAVALFGLNGIVSQASTSAMSEMGLPLSQEESELLEDGMRRQLSSLPASVWVERLRSADIPCMPVLRPGECLLDEHVRSYALAVRFTDGCLTRFGAGSPLAFEETDSTPLGLPRWPLGMDEAAATDESGPLAGLKILDFGIYMAGPYGSRILRDLGAQVTKIEHPAGDPMRPLDRIFSGSNRGKRSIAIDLKTPDGQEIATKLAARADVVSHNLRPGVAEQIGIGYSQLSAVNPGLIYCHASAFGLRGSMSSMPGFEPLASAFVGLLDRAGGRGNPPMLTVGSMDPGNGLMGALGILMALYRRAWTEVGVFVDCPQLGTAIFSTSEVTANESGGIEDPFAIDADQYGHNWTSRLYQCSDGWIVVECLTDEHRSALTSMASIPIGTSAEKAAEQLSRWCNCLSVEDASSQLRLGGVPVTVVEEGDEMRYLFLGNLTEQRIATYTHSTFGTMRDFGSFWRFTNETLSSKRGRLPQLGEDTVDILCEHGYADSEVTRLIDQCVVVQS